VLINSLKEGASDSAILRRVKDKISLKDFNIKSICFRKAASGGILLEVLDPNVTSDRVDVLAGAMDVVLSGCANVSRPVRRVEFWLRGFDPSTTVDEVRESVAEAGGCLVSAVSVNGTKRLNSDHRVAWVSCPESAARLLSESKYLKVGWSSAFVDSRHVKKPQCYSCWRYGHVRGTCKASADRSGCCFRCGKAGHLAGTCTNDLLCVLCKERGIGHAQAGYDTLQKR